jgi:2-keto-4-pentenoate hydratase/2-oxohepta-3-ene-1,7-dioic acid hydratase in catechol pathway
MERRVRFSLNPNLDFTTPDGSPEVRYGVVEGDQVIETSSLTSTDRGASHPRGAVRLMPPCSPSKIVCVGRNYLEHAKELGNEPGAEPLIFLKPPSALNAAGGAVVHPPISQRLDYEGELGLVIGHRVRNVSAGEAEQAILGYTCVDDFTLRDLQKKDGQWTRAKGFDTSCSVGPWMVPRADVDFAALRVRTLVNGVVRQDASVLEMMFPPGAIISFVSQFMTLEPGDLIATGTPSGIGPLAVGDKVQVQIEGIGTLDNVVAASTREP